MTYIYTCALSGLSRRETGLFAQSTILQDLNTQCQIKVGPPFDPQWDVALCSGYG